ncbi:MAG TPA: FtsX-like permease family protein [Methylibium sp.]|uniref:ABC transporter permease n=1 Tax=Methylibium sp. TaxID=2067992 RepID=UPI002DBD54A3|nr:FtsX-like permease family protein [Methylibium sp.]HEU4458224.1 FtsX-like permease family protein [Methylibium sp.]
MKTGAMHRPSLWRAALRQLVRDFRAGELRLLLVAVMLAVAALTAVGFFADRLNAGLARDARSLLGGDAIVSSDQPAPAALAERARADGLRVTRTVAFPSMGRAEDARGGASRLVAVKAVADGYPLRGTLKIADAPGGAERTATGGPERGTVWVDAAVLGTLNLRVGDALLLGDATLRIAAVIALEPDRGAGFMSFAPRALLNLDDLPATGLIQPASRVGYRLAVAAPPGMAAAEGDRRVRAFTDWTEAQIAQQHWRGVQVESLESGRPEMRQALDRGARFLNLVALLAALLAAVAVGIAARDFAQRHLDDCAMLRVLGESQRRIAGAYTIEFAIVGVLASSLGVLLGLAVHFVFVVLLAGLVESSLPAPGVWPAVFGLGVGLTLLLGFGLPPVLQLARVPPLRVIRRDLGELKPGSIVVLAAGALGFAALLLAVASDLRLGLITVGGFAGAVALFAALSWLAVQVLRRAVPQAASTAPRWLILATRQVAARPGFAVLQVSSLSVGLLALVLLVLLRTDLISSWNRATPPDAPNRFVINVQPEQAQAFRAQLAEAGVARYDWYPMIRGRLVAVNGREVAPGDYTEDRAMRLVEREFNLSHDARLPEHNEVVAGRWRAEEPGAISVEEGIAKTLNLKLGDTLRFDIAGVLQEGRITSLRKVDWGSMRANFFVIFPNAQLSEALPTTYMAAFRAPLAEPARTPGAPASAPADGETVRVASSDFDNALARNFPNITSVDVSASIAQVQRVLDQVIRAVEFLFGFTLATGLVVLFAAVTATREQRAREFAVMRALGAGAALLGRVQRTELLGVGALAGALASIAALVVGWALARWVFEFDWNAPLWVPLAGAAAGGLLALLAGWWGLREVLARPVVETLRRAAL